MVEVVVATAAVKTSSKLSVLVIDDDQDIREYLQDFLSTEGFEVTTLADPTVELADDSGASAADGITLLEKFEGKLNSSGSNLMKAAVDLAKDWRQDRALRRLEALLIVGNTEHLLVLSGTGDVIEPDEGIAAIGSGGPYAQAAAMALLHHSALDAETIAREALKIASQICIFTNAYITVETA